MKCFIVNHWLPAVLFALVCLRCNTGVHSPPLKSLNYNAIYALAGDNTSEIKKIVQYYTAEKDSFKKVAAFYLLTNLQDQFHFEGAVIGEYRKWFSYLDQHASTNILSYNRATWDSIQSTVYFNNDLQTELDLKSIGFNQFKENIDQSFEIWKLPWARQMNFEAFKKYILPIKVSSEKIDSWKKEIQTDYKALLDTVNPETSAYEVCKLINTRLMKSFYINAKVQCPWSLNYTDFKKLRTGTCGQAAGYTSMVMRAMGVPVVVDYTPFWGNKNGGHEWNALVINDTPFHFIGSESHPGMDKVEFTKSYLLRRKRPKIFRRCFEMQANSLSALVSDADSIPTLFRSAHIEDVTAQYVPVSEVGLHLQMRPQGNHQFAYLAVFNGNGWEPTAWSAIDKQGDVLFKNLGRDILYLPVLYQDNEILPAANPFILDKKGNVIFLKPNFSTKHNMVVKAKYPEDKSNLIFKGERYELLVWNKYWTSLGIQVAKADSLVYPAVPDNGLFWVRNIDKGFQERVFTYAENKQVWW